MTKEKLLKLFERLPDFERMVETHISWVLLCGQFAYKFKKALHLHFLDFSSLEKRKIACQKELELNRRLEPEIYLDLVKMVEENGGPVLRALEEAGDALEFGVKMKRLDTDFELDCLLKKDAVPSHYMEILAKKIAEFHRSAIVIKDENQANVAAYQSDFKDLFSLDAALLAGCGGDSKALNNWQRISDRFLEKMAPLLADRLKAGLVRDLHGDLHTGNIFAYPEPVIFDCIEFNEHFRQIDVLNEIAFLLMDLEAMEKHALAEKFLKSYQQCFPEAFIGQECLQLLIWFKAYRANIRAKVNAIKHGQDGCESSKAAASRYLQLMGSYLAKLEKA